MHRHITTGVAGALLTVQIGWLLAGGSLGSISVVTVIVTTALTVTLGRFAVLNAIGRVYLGLVFGASVADRFGLLGAPGASGVSWGSYNEFVDYTRDLLPTAVRWSAPTLALTATIVEVVVAALLIVGVRRKLAAGIACAMVAVFGIAMWTSVGFGSMASYAVPAVIAGLAILTSVRPRRTEHMVADRAGSATIRS